MSAAHAKSSSKSDIADASSYGCGYLPAGAGLSVVVSMPVGWKTACFPASTRLVRSALVGLVAQNKQLSEALLRLQLAVQYPTAETHHPDCRA